MAAAIGSVSLLIVAPLSPWIDGTAFDLLFWLDSRGANEDATERTSPVSVIAIDEATYDRAPFAGTPRALWTPQFAIVLNALLDSGVRVVGFDTVFATSAMGLVSNYDREFLLALRRAATDDRVVIGELLAHPESVSPSPAFGFAVANQRNIRPINIARDRDGILRRIPLFFDLKQGMKPAFSLELAARFKGQTASRADHGGITLGGHPVPGTADGFLFLNPDFLGRPKPTYSFADIHECAVAGDEEFFRKHFSGRVVIIGSDLLAEDRKVASNRFVKRRPQNIAPAERCRGNNAVRVSPPSVGNTIAGVQVHAVAVRQLLGNGGPNTLRGPGSWFALFLAAFLFAVASITARPLATLGFLVLAIGGPLAISLIAFWNLLVLPLGGLCLAALLGTGGMTGYRRFVLDRDKRYLRRVFSLYLPSPQINKLVAEGQSPHLGGEQRTVSIVFVDIERYSEISETLAPTAAAALLNNCFDRLSKIVDRHNGYIDKFVGDGLLGIFGAPLVNPHHAASAVAASIEMQRSLRNRPIETAVGPLLLRIGINTGSVLIGNIGSKRRFNYTVVGDAVNLAARLENLNKTYGTRILVSEATTKMCQALVFREVDLVTVMGRSHPTRIFEPIPTEAEDSEVVLDPSRYSEALELYRRGVFREARALFDGMARYDPVSKAMSARCAKYESDPPGDGWDGVFRMDHK